LAKLEQAKREQADREALRIAALKRQQELEDSQKNLPVRTDYSNAYWRQGPCYYLGIGVHHPSPQDAVHPVPLR
jgi:hypothetical protein